MPAKTTKKTTARKTTVSKPKSTDEQIQEIVEAERNAKPCAYPSCSQRASQEVSEVPCCDAHASIFEEQANDGAGIQHIVESYKGP